MREWRIAPFDTLCGGPCTTTVKQGQPIYAVQVPGLATRFRCQACTKLVYGEVPPADLKAREDVPIRPLVKLPTGIGMLSFDWKKAQMPREPGEDDV